MADYGVLRGWAQQQIGGANQAKPPTKTWLPERSSERWWGPAWGRWSGPPRVTRVPAPPSEPGGPSRRTSIGTNEGAASGYQLQRRYDIADQQLNGTARGNFKIPGFVRQSGAILRTAAATRNELQWRIMGHGTGSVRKRAMGART